MGPAHLGTAKAGEQSSQGRENLQSNDGAGAEPLRGEEGKRAGAPLVIHPGQSWSVCVRIGTQQMTGRETVANERHLVPQIDVDKRISNELEKEKGTSEKDCPAKKAVAARMLADLLAGRHRLSLRQRARSHRTAVTTFAGSTRCAASPHPAEPLPNPDPYLRNGKRDPIRASAPRTGRG